MAGNVNRRELYFCISANVFEYLNNPGNLSLQRSVTAWTAARWLWLINLFHRVASLADLAKWHRRWLFQKAGFLAFLFGDQTRNRSAGCWVGMVSRFFTASDILMVLRNHKIGGWHFDPMKHWLDGCALKVDLGVTSFQVAHDTSQFHTSARQENMWSFFFLIFQHPVFHGHMSPPVVCLVVCLLLFQARNA